MKAAAIAAVAVLAVAVGIYGIGDRYGNVASVCAGAAAASRSLLEFAVGDVAAFRPAPMPFRASDLRFEDAGGVSRTLREWQGKTVLLNLWATWCAPCRAEMPALESLQKDRGGDDFEVVAVSVDLGDSSKPKRFYEEVGLKDLAFHHEGKMAVFNELKKNGLAFGLPVSLLIDGQGCVLGILNAPAEWAGSDARALVEAAVRLPDASQTD